MIRYTLLGCLLSITSTLVGQEMIDSSPTYESGALAAPPVAPWVARVEGGYAFGKFMGYERDYAEVGVFVMPRTSSNWVPFVDLRGYLINNGKGVLGLGVGVRRWNSSWNRAFGGNVYYNYQDAAFSPFQRIGVGVESLGRNYDLRFNGYLVINGQSKSGRLHTFDYPGGFSETCRIKETAVSGADAEIGKNIWRSRRLSLYCAGGPYYYQHKCFRVYGGYLRSQLKVSRYLTVSAGLSEDNKYHTQFQAKVLFSFPLGNLYSSLYASEFNKYEILSQSVWRNPLIPTHKCCDRHGNWE